MYSRITQGGEVLSNYLYVYSIRHEHFQQQRVNSQEFLHLFQSFCYILAHQTECFSHILYLKTPDCVSSEMWELFGSQASLTKTTECGGKVTLFERTTYSAYM